MSLNNKYIINGSTLSDIGNALRTKEIISESVTIKPLNMSITIKPPQGQTTEKETRTIDLSSFSFLPTKLRQRAKIAIYGYNASDSSSWAIWNPWFEKIQTSTGEQITSFPISSNSPIEVDFPLTITMHKLPYSQGPSQSLSGSYNTIIRIVQLLPQSNKYEGYYLPSDFTNFSSGYTYSSDNMIAYYAGQGSNTTVTNTIPVEDIASTIMQLQKTDLITPLIIGTYDNYTNTSTVLPTYIQSITDIKKLIMRLSANRLALLEPATAQTTQYQSLGGDLGSGTCYRMPYVDVNANWSMPAATWESNIKNSSTYYDIYFKADTRQLLVCSIGGGTQIHAAAFPAVLIH